MQHQQGQRSEGSNQQCFDGCVRVKAHAGTDEAPKIEDHPEFGAKIAYFAGTPVMLAIPSTPESWVSERIGQLGQCPIAFLLHAGDFKAASEHFSLPKGKPWFNFDVSWFDVKKLHGVRLGIVGG